MGSEVGGDGGGGSWKRWVDEGVGSCDGRRDNGIVGGMWQDGAKVAMRTATKRGLNASCVGFQGIL